MKYLCATIIDVNNTFVSQTQTCEYAIDYINGQQLIGGILKHKIANTQQWRYHLIMPTREIRRTA